MEGQAITRFQRITKKQELELKNVPIAYSQFYDTRLQLHNHLAHWKSMQRKLRPYRKEEFYYDGYLCNVESNAQTVMYITDYKYSDRQSRRRLCRIESFISRHCLDNEIKLGYFSQLILNKTNSKCIDTEYYIKNFQNYILQEINIVRPTIIIAFGCYDIVTELLSKCNGNENLSVISSTPIVNMLPLTTKCNDHKFLIHFEYIYFRQFGWNI